MQLFYLKFKKLFVILILMRLICRIFYIFLVSYLFLILFISPAKAACSEDSYGNCTGTCSCSSYGLCGSCYCAWQSENYCGATGCSPCSTTRGYGGGQPTDTPIPNPPLGGAVCPNSSYPNCSGSDYCTVVNCGKTIANCPNPPIPTVPNCSSVCLNGHCYTTNPGTNPTITDVPCSSPNNYGPWSGCLSEQGACGGCAAQNYTCQVRYCITPPNSNQYQISCGCNQPPGGGGSNLYLSIVIARSAATKQSPCSEEIASLRSQ